VSKNVAMFVDVANLYYSARGQDVDVDYVALLKSATKGRDLIRAYAYSGLDPDNENQRKFIDFLGKNGYKVMTKDIRKFGDGRVKANLDIELVVDLLRLADRMDIAVIVSGDGDFAPAIRACQDRGVRCEVISFRPNTSSDLMAVADEFIDIMKIAGIGRNSKEAKAQRGMSAPEMPAKEVTPEFGFREASPSVAKAALAAIKGGGREGENGSADRGRRRRRGPTAEAEEQPAAAESATEDASEATAASAGDAEPRRRRRRRGGRGRGRGRGHSEQAETAAAEAGGDGEIGWVELDDISQLAELEGIGDLDADREYSFEEADESTLAELGLTAAESKATADEAATGTTEEPEPKKPARRSRTRKATADEAATGTTEEAEPKKPARRRATTRKSTATATKAEAKPAASRSRTRKSTTRAATSSKAGDEAASSTSPADAGEGEEQEGIWKRFRSARGSKTAS
jgi:uncharacterized LabA/DUF88 family protein